MKTEFGSSAGRVIGQIVTSKATGPAIVLLPPDALPSHLPTRDAIVCLLVRAPSDAESSAEKLAEVIRGSKTNAVLQGALIFPHGTLPRDYAEQLPTVTAHGIGWFVSPDERIDSATLDKLRSLIVDPEGEPAWLRGDPRQALPGERLAVERTLGREESELPPDRNLDEYFR